MNRRKHEPRRSSITTKSDRVRERIRALYQTLRRRYPHCPNPWRVAESAFRRRDGVGFDDTLTLGERADRAAASYIRHTCLPYHELLAEGWARETTRALIGERLFAILDAWRGRPTAARAA